MSKNLERTKFKSNCGSRFRFVYERQYINGEPVVVIKEKIDQYEEIQTYKDDNNIYKILSRVGGDISKLDFNKGVYIDVSQIPDNYNDFMNLNSSIRSDYDRLPVEFKQALKNNFNLYYGLAINGNLKEVIDKISKGINVKKDIDNIDFNFNKEIKPVDVSKSEVKKDE